jgi:hypothetical protein
VTDSHRERVAVDPPLTTDELKTEASKLALPLLVERLGGVVELTVGEYQAFVQRHGGSARNIGVQIERTRTGLRFTIIHVDREPLT